MVKLDGSRNGTKRGRVEIFQEVRSELAARLRSRSTEIEEVIFARARAVPDVAGSEDAEYITGLRQTVAAIVDYGLTSIEQGEQWSGPIPSVAVAQARRAARHGVGLETVLLRYAAGSRLLGDYIMAEGDGHPGEALRHALDVQGSLLERLMTEVSIEYKRELEWARRSSEHRRAELVRRLLIGEPVDPAELGYELDAWHLGVIASGSGASEGVRSLAAGLDRRPLMVADSAETVWAWFGDRGRVPFSSIERAVSGTAPDGPILAVGEPGRGIDGWRTTHRQAQAALLVALRRRQKLTRYVDIALLAAALRDELLASSLREVFLAPLESQRDGGAALRETLRRYFAAGRNASSAAVPLNVARHTVENRLRMVEQCLGRPIHTCWPELEVALRLDELGGAPDVPAPTGD
jgi:hypothetical protein